MQLPEKRRKEDKLLVGMEKEGEEERNFAFQLLDLLIQREH